MPNWCMNTIRVYGPAGELDTFLADAQGIPEWKTQESPLVLERLLPAPPEALAADGGYEWKCENWGTQWDLCEAGMEERTNGLREGWRGVEFECRSAWMPPLAAFQSISSKYPNLEFDMEYDEPGMWFGGTAFFRAGKSMHFPGDCRLRSVSWDDEDEDSE